MVAYWLLKEEPSHYSYDQLVKDGRTVWNGVRNNLALKYLRMIRRGDEAFYYHTGGETSVVGIVRAVSDPYPDPAESDPRLVVVDVEPIRKLARPVTLAQVKSNPIFKGFQLLRIPRLSVMPVPLEMWKEVLRLSLG